MRARTLSLVVIALLTLAGGLVYALGLDGQAARLVVSLQRDYQNALGQVLRALRAGEPGAVSSFLGICFAYGFLHALGPGHGKALIAGYALATGGALRRLVGIAALASLGQATVAIVLIYAGVWLFEGARDRIEGLAAKIEPVAMLAIAALGLMLLWRGIGHLRKMGHLRKPGHEPSQDHIHHHDCGCGHAHAPGPEVAARAQGLRELLALSAGIALRPCTGALFLLILTWRLGIDGLGILGAYVMGFGTFMITALAALLALGLRRGMRIGLQGFSGAGVAAGRAAALIEIFAGALIAILGLMTALRMF